MVYLVRYIGGPATKENTANALKLLGAGAAIARRIVNGESLCVSPHDLDALKMLAAQGLIEMTANQPEAPMPTITYDGVTHADEHNPPKTKDILAFNKALDNPADQLATILRSLAGGLDEGRVVELIKQHAAGPATVKIDLVTEARDVRFEGAMHREFPKLLAAVSQRVNVMMVGPAGSGKTTAAQKVAKALGLPFYFTGAINSEYKLTGFIDAQGRIVSTAFRKAFVEGGVFLFDEMDGSLPAATLAFNAATANRVYDFPDGSFEAHPNFIALAACNTYGNGASRQYVGRNQLDAATLDRYATLDWNYDEALEAAIMGLPRPGGAPVPKDIAPLKADRLNDVVRDWVQRVQRVRKAIDKLKVRHVVSPRASQIGSKLLAAGWTWDDVEASVIWKGLEPDTINKVKEAA
jgi:hypothetical protein